VRRPDHGNDPALLERWPANKQPEIVAGWIARADSSMLVAVEDDTILAVGSVSDAGEITLNYVSPHARVRGVSRALLKALEAGAAERGNTACRAAQHGNGASVLSGERLCRCRRADPQVRHELGLSDVEANRAVTRLVGTLRFAHPTRLSHSTTAICCSNIRRCHEGVSVSQDAGWEKRSETHHVATAVAS
jgi:GNAT superfamily N-acetyltransferase